MKSMVFRRPQGLSSILATLRVLQPRALQPSKSHTFHSLYIVHSSCTLQSALLLPSPDTVQMAASQRKSTVFNS